MYSCVHCKSTPCLWRVHKEAVIDEAEYFISMHESRNDGRRPSNNLIRKECYKKFVFACHGTLGRGNRVEIPKSALAAIRKTFNDETFMGYQDS